MILYAITPVLGSLKNYIKYKRLNPFTFIRTPIVYFILQFIFQTNNIWKILTFERWVFFLFKACRSLWRDDYNSNKEKYKIKYGLSYDN